MAKLNAFKEEHGHCEVKKRDGTLGRWVYDVRSRYKNSNRDELKPDLRKQLERLDQMGFMWASTKKKKGVSQAKVGDKKRSRKTKPVLATKTELI